MILKPWFPARDMARHLALMPAYKRQQHIKGIFSARRESGFTVLYAVLIIAALVSIGTAIINTALREVRIAGTGDKSVRAQYAAESALECITYWMVQDADAFGGAAALTETCNGTAPQVESGSYNIDNRVAAYEYKATVDMGAAGCAYVYVDTDSNLLRADGFYPSCGSGAQTERSLIGTYATKGASAGEIIGTNPNEPKCQSFTASPASVSSGGAATLTWSTQNATGVDIQKGIGSSTPSGSVTVNPLVTTEYTLTAFNGPSTPGEVCHVTVTVPDKPSLPTSGLLGWWKLEEGSGTAVVDSAVSYVSGDTANNGVVNDAIWSTYTYGAGSASSLLFADDPGSIVPQKYTYVQISPSGAMQTLRRGTVAAWVRLGVIDGGGPGGGSTGNYTIFSTKCSSGNPNGWYFKVFWYQLEFNASKVIRTSNIFSKSGAWRSEAKDGWMLVAASFDSFANKVRFYVNGQFVEEVATSFSLGNGASNAFIGARACGDPYKQIFGGYIDDVWVYNRVLSDQEIADLYNYSVN